MSGTGDKIVNSVSNSSSHDSKFKLTNDTGIYNIEVTNNSKLQLRGIVAGDINLKITNNSTVNIAKCTVGEMVIVITNNSYTFINGSRIDNLVGALLNNSELDGNDNSIAKRNVMCSNKSSSTL